jgi:hypothetical protein
LNDGAKVERRLESKRKRSTVKSQRKGVSGEFWREIALWERLGAEKIESLGDFL